MFDWENKKLYIILLIVIFVLFLIYFFYPREQEYQMEMVKPVHPKIKKKEQLFKKVEEEVKTDTFVEKKPTIVVNEPENLEERIENKRHILYSSRDSSGRYTIQLVSDIKITIENKNLIRFVPIHGKILDDENSNSFNLSLSEEYLEYVSDLLIIVKDITDKKRYLECSASFLNGLNINTEYNIKINIIGDSLNCYIESEKSIPSFIIESLKKGIGPTIIDTKKHNEKLKNLK